ncbi:hypothetical protein RJT34_02829 [Clitoria ternatea]|uniref:Uncharacterized protein n=1 Tax=Clitoria ternatea TaxID=43366 RepID=A0AAN9KKK1_CLITE
MAPKECVVANLLGSGKSSTWLTETYGWTHLTVSTFEPDLSFTSFSQRKSKGKEQREMAGPKHSFTFALVALLATLIFAVHAQTTAPAPAPTSHGSSVDQGIAYVLMLLALVLTYLIH